MNFFNKLSLRHRLLLVTLPTTALLYTLAAYVIHTTQVSGIFNNSRPLMEQHLSNLSDLISTYNKQVTSEGDFAKRLINDLQTKLSVNPEDTAAMSLKWKLLKQAEQFEQEHHKRTGENKFEDLKESFYSKRYYKSGFPYVIDAKGYFVIHPNREKENVLSEAFFREMQEMRKGVLELYDEKLLRDIYVFYSFDMESEMYVCILVPKKEFIDEQIRSVDLAIIFLGILAVLSFSLFIYFLARAITRPLRMISVLLQNILTGNFRAEIMDYPYNDIIRRILDALNEHIKHLQSAAKFADSIREGNYTLEFNPLGNDDDLGNALIAMRNNLMKAEEERHTRKKEDEIRRWEAEGIARFNDLLRQSGQSFESFSYIIIKGIADYVSAHLGAIFIYDQKDFSGGIHTNELVLVASHAYEQKKFIDRRFKTGEGLVGVCAAEKKSVFLTEVPDNYLKIRSGLGDSKPRSLLFVPILLEDGPFGVIELASMHVFQHYEVEFVEKISTTIATTLANVKNSIRTQELLRDSQKYTDQMRLQEELMKAQLDEMILEKEMSDKELETLKASENRFNLVFEKSIQPIMIADEKGKIQLSNQAALQLFGVENEQVKEFHIQELIIIKDMKLFFSRLGQWQRVKAIHMEGKITPVEVFMSLVSARGEKIMLVYIRNISRLAAMENEIKRHIEDNMTLRNRITDQKKRIEELEGED